MSPTEPEVTERLRAMGELYRLGQSLKDAGGVRFTQTQVLARSLRILGVLGHPAPHDVLLRVGPSARRYDVGHELTAVFDVTSLVYTETYAIIVGLVDDDGRAHDSLAPHTAATLRVRFPLGFPALSSELALGELRDVRSLAR